MEQRPNIGDMIRCVGPSYDVGAVTFYGHDIIQLPRRTELGKLIPGALDSYQLIRVGKEWVYKFTPQPT